MERTGGERLTAPATMDTILDVFFEKVFSQLPRGALVSRYKRAELSDYFGTVIVGCVGAEHVSDYSLPDRCRRRHHNPLGVRRDGRDR